jgi:hypothetical protein
MKKREQFLHIKMSIDDDIHIVLYDTNDPTSLRAKKYYENAHNNG